MRVLDQMLLVVDPGIGAVLAAEAIFDRVLAFLEQISDLGLDARKILRVHALAPEIGILEIFARGIAEQPRDVLAHKQWREIIPGLEAVDHHRGGVEQACKLHLRRGLNLGEMLAFLFFVLARCFGQDTLYDVGHFSGIGTGFQHFSKRGGSNLCVFSWGSWGI
jgi:hypothetical protein